MKTIKNLFLLTCLCTTLLYCSDDDGDSANAIQDQQGTVVTSEIIGEWSLTKETYRFDGETETFTADCSSEQIFMFSTTSYTERYDDDCDTTVDYENSGDYSIENTNENPYVLELEFSETYTILKLNNDKLILKVIYDFGETDQETALYEFEKVN